MMLKARDIMTAEVVTIKGSATVADAVEQMNDLCLRA
ncbi:MAG: CBS domain-containing protein, partial [Planktothrix sp.]